MARHDGRVRRLGLVFLRTLRAIGVAVAKRSRSLARAKGSCRSGALLLTSREVAPLPLLCRRCLLPLLLPLGLGLGLRGLDLVLGLLVLEEFGLDLALDAVDLEFSADFAFFGALLGKYIAQRLSVKHFAMQRY